MKKIRQALFVSLGILITPLFVHAAEIQNFAFISNEQAITTGAVSEQITIEAQSAGVPINGNTVCIQIQSSSPTGEFSTNGTTWGTEPTRKLALTLATNQYRRNFYYRDQTDGAYTLNVRAGLKPSDTTCPNWSPETNTVQWTVSQSITVGNATPNENASATATTTPSIDEPSSDPSIPAPPPPANSGGSTWVYKPQMFVSALVPQRAVAGAPVTFDAAAVGVKKEPLVNARYIWSFGDGGVAEGKKVQHTYHYPATYTVLVDASSGEWSALDKKEIAIATPELVITGIKEGGDGYIEVKNNGQSEVDLSDWLLLAGSGSFRFPRGTVIGAKKAVPFPAAITGLPADSLSTVLLYPNGTPVVAYAEKPAVPESVPVKTEEPKTLAVTATQEVASPKPVSIPEPVPTEVKKKTALPSATLPPLASSTELIGAVGATKEDGMMPWLSGVTLLLVVSVGGYMAMLRPKPEKSAAEQLRKEAATYDIME